jgi:thiosulfate/3-mercaptopyruvate sulfurtransferase
LIPPVVDGAWLAAHPAAVVCDVRWYLDGRSGLEAYRAGHVPGAVFVDLDRALAGPPSPAAGRHPLPDPEVFARELGALGVGDADTVVAYDDTNGMSAARLVWMLRIIGQDAALLDGWDGPLARGDDARPAARRAVRPWPADRLATIDEVAAGVPGALVDARAPERYRGETEPVDPRPGHIPGAVNVPFAGNVGPDGRWLAPDDLRARFAAAGVRAGDDVVAYCGSGVSACCDLLALERAGLGARARLYPGSWSQWSSDPSRPAATGS